MKNIFDEIAERSSEYLGSASAFIFAVLICLVWLISGPIFHWSNTWQLIINTGTTVVTFLMIFLVQSSQNKDTKAIQLKLDRIIEDSVDVKSEDMVGIEKDKEKLREKE